MNEAFCVEREISAGPGIGVVWDDEVDVESLTAEANRLLGSMAALAFSVNEAAVGDPVWLMGADAGTEVRRFAGEELLDLAHKVRMLEGLLYDRCD